MQADPSTGFRRATVMAVVMVLFGVLIAPASSAQVTTDDIAAAEAELEAARERLDEIQSKLDDARQLRSRLEATIESVSTRRADADDRAASEVAEVRNRLTRMYMAAGRSDLVVFAVGDLGIFFTRLAYLGAVANRDREVVSQFVVFSGDLEGLEQRARVEMSEVAEEIEALEVSEAARSDEFDQAEERVQEVRAEWERQEAARRAALEAEIRQREEALAQQAAASTTTTAPSTGSGTTVTTTAPGGFAPDDGGYTYVPGGGVEQWRPLLTSIFARWGLDQEKCGPNGCLGPHIDDALTIMWCESRGVPFAVNPSSGTTGLFQHRPPSVGYWADRVARTRSKPWSTLPADATAYNPAHNIEVAALLIWESRETLIGNLGFGRPWSDGPQPFGHWDGTSRYCANPPLVYP